MAIYNDQALGDNFDPGSLPTLPMAVTVISITMNDADNDGFLSPNGSDQINGSNITSVWVGDTVTIDGVQITGVTFYTADLSRYFTPNDGTVLTPGTVSATTYVNTSTQMPVGDLGPPCFVAGSRIATLDGLVAVEDLEVGQLVQTMDHGMQKIRWIGHRTVKATGKFAPIVISKGALGNDGNLRVSPQHRMLISGWESELLFGEDQVLAAAKHLVNGDTIYVQEGGDVEYFHIMFDQHEIIYANGSPSESFHPGEMALNSIEKDARDELFALFPELEVSPQKYGPAVRAVLRSHETKLLARSYA